MKANPNKSKSKNAPFRNINHNLIGTGDKKHVGQNCCTMKVNCELN